MTATAESRPVVTVTPTGLGEFGLPATAYPGEASSAPQDIPATAGSALAGLRDRVRKARAERFHDLRIPGLGADDDPCDPEALYLRLVPLGASQRWELEQVSPETFESDWRDSVKTLVASCVGIFPVDAQGHPIGDPASWPRLDATTAEAMGLTLNVADDPFGSLLRELFCDEADVMTMAAAHTRWSRLTSQTRERQTRERQNPEA